MGLVRPQPVAALVGRTGHAFGQTRAIRCCRLWVKVPHRRSRMPPPSRVASRSSPTIFRQRCVFTSSYACRDLRACRACRKPTRSASICLTGRRSANAMRKWPAAQRTGHGPRSPGSMSTMPKWSRPLIKWPASRSSWTAYTIDPIKGRHPNVIVEMTIERTGRVTGAGFKSLNRIKKGVFGVLSILLHTF